MIRVDTAKLIKELPRAHGVHSEAEETSREVMVEIRSVSRSEFYNAYNAGLQPEIVLYMQLAEDYCDEKLVEFRGKRYRIIRTYMTEEDGIELTLQRSDVK